MPWFLYWLLWGAPVVTAASLVTWLVLFPRMSGMVIGSIREQPDASNRQVWAELQIVHAVDEVAHGRHRLSLYLVELAGALAFAVAAKHQWGTLIGGVALAAWAGWMWMTVGSIKRRQWPQRYEYNPDHFPGRNSL